MMRFFKALMANCKDNGGIGGEVLEVLLIPS